MEKMRWVGHVARMGVKRDAYRVWWENLRERDHLGDPDVEGRIILIRIFRKCVVGAWTGSSCLGIGGGML